MEKIGKPKQKELYPQVNGLEYKVDMYKCAKIDCIIENNSKYFSDDFKIAENKISNLLELFQSLKLKAIWVVIPINSSHLISSFAKNNFKFHHVEKDEELIMYKWLLDTPSTLPKYAAHYLGVGGLIINSQGKILLVKEKKTIKQLKDLWKIPTGLAENGETIGKAIERETKEETGLDVKFQGIMNMREAYPYMFNTTDIFFICLCKCEGEQEIDIVQGGELTDCKWFTKEEIEELIKNKMFSPFSAKLFKDILPLIPNKIFDRIWRPGKEVEFVNTKFIFYTPKF